MYLWTKKKKYNDIGIRSENSLILHIIINRMSYIPVCLNMILYIYFISSFIYVHRNNINSIILY